MLQDAVRNSCGTHGGAIHPGHADRAFARQGRRRAATPCGGRRACCRIVSQARPLPGGPAVTRGWSSGRAGRRGRLRARVTTSMPPVGSRGCCLPVSSERSVMPRSCASGRRTNAFIWVAPANRLSTAPDPFQVFAEVAESLLFYERLREPAVGPWRRCLVRLGHVLPGVGCRSGRSWKIFEAMYLLIF